jgi:hypothetical protein
MPALHRITTRASSLPDPGAIEQGETIELIAFVLGVDDLRDPFSETYPMTQNLK